MQEKRKDIRTRVALKVKISHPEYGDLTATTSNISDGGAFIITPPGVDIPVGTVLKIQLMDVAQPVPVLHMQVIRKEPLGIAVKFIR